MDSTDQQQPAEQSRRRPSSLAVLAAGGLAGLVLGLGGMASAADPAPSTSSSTGVQQVATTDDPGASAADDGLCDEPADGSADAEASSTSARA